MADEKQAGKETEQGEGQDMQIFHTRGALARAAGRTSATSTQWKLPTPDARIAEKYGWRAATLREWAQDRRPDLLDAIDELEASEEEGRKPPFRAAQQYQTKGKRGRHDQV